MYKRSAPVVSTLRCATTRCTSHRGESRDGRNPQLSPQSPIAARAQRLGTGECENFVRDKERRDTEQRRNQLDAQAEKLQWERCGRKSAVNQLSGLTGQALVEALRCLVGGDDPGGRRG